MAYARQFGQDGYESDDQALLREAAVRAAAHQFFTDEDELYEHKIKFKIRLAVPDRTWEERIKALITRARASN